MKFISEKTLYKYVFCQKALAEEERLYISQNIEKFSEDLELLNVIKSTLENELPNTILDKIHRKIIKASAKDGITLNLIPPTKGGEKSVLAADSEDSEPNQNTYSYIDESNNYLIKVINKDSANKIYIFTRAGIEDLEFSVTLFPSKEVFYLNSDDMPLIVSPQQKIKSFILKTN